MDGSSPAALLDALAVLGPAAVTTPTVWAARMAARPIAPNAILGDAACGRVMTGTAHLG
jgi:hypothetical protein